MLALLDRRVLAAIAAGVIGVGVTGYLAGHGGGAGGSHEQGFSAAVAGVLLNLPPAWRTAGEAAAVPGLSLSQPLLLAPGGNASNVGLLVGALPSSEPGPLPRQLLARMHRLPATSVVSLQEAQAYRYSAVSIPGFARQMTLYVVPNPGGSPTALACYAAAALAAYLQDCQRIVATLTLAGQSQSYDLTPQPSYASRLSAAVSSLNTLRAGLRRGMGPQVAPATVQRLATRLAGAFARAAAAVSALESNLATGQAQAELSSSILRARAAYRSLAAAAAAHDQARFAAARTRVSQAEAGVDEALTGFALLGYQPS
jgi:hypothetical protein